jgi:putative membrane protein
MGTRALMQRNSVDLPEPESPMMQTTPPLMFFLNRIQHVVMHHLGPFLMALGSSGGMIKRGMPLRLRRIAESGYVAAAMRVLQQPMVAAFLFVGLFYFWLIPMVHFRAMIDARLYAVMNWSMVLDGILF